MSRDLAVLGADLIRDPHKNNHPTCLINQTFFVSDKVRLRGVPRLIRTS